MSQPARSILAAFALALAAIAPAPPTAAEVEYEPRIQGPPQDMGSWEPLQFECGDGLRLECPADETPRRTACQSPCNLGMQAVHTVVLPSGKVLMVSGSSLRNLAPSERFPSGGGALDAANIPKLTWEELYRITDNSGLYDPVAGTFRRIASPQLPVDLRPGPRPDPFQILTDPFCSGHLQLPDGHVLLVGGTQTYSPYTGGKTSYIFDWRKESWTFAGITHDGHWYPNLVLFPDGRVVVFSGLAFDHIRIPDPTPSSFGVPYVSPILEIFDPKRFEASNPQRAWSWLDARELPGNPWARPLWPGSVRNDTFVLYPRIFPLPDGRLFLSQEGSIQLTSDGSGAPGNNRNTYFFILGPRGDQRSSRFEHGPDKPHVYRFYGTGVEDPWTGDLLFLAGQQGPDHGYDGYNWNAPQAGIQARSDLTIYRLPDAEHPDGRWEEVRGFLGDRPEDGRVNLLSVLLPTRQMLVLHGGNFSLGRPLFEPLLATRDPAKPGGWRLNPMNQHTQPRLYHNTAALLPDGRVLAAGGNNPRAVYDLETGEVQFPTTPGAYAIVQEVWEAEIFSPPYLFTPGPRAVIRGVSKLVEIARGGEYLRARPEVLEPPGGDDRLIAGQAYLVELDNLNSLCEPAAGSLVLIKLGSVTHGWDSGQRLIELPAGTYRSVQGTLGEQTTYPTLVFAAPEIGPTVPLGYYMLFYVDCQGKPSVAQIVRLVGKEG